MKVLVYSARAHDISLLTQCNHRHHELIFTEASLQAATVEKAESCEAISISVTDPIDCSLMEQLAQQRVKIVALRSCGFDHVDLAAARVHNIAIVRVPRYAPEAIAEFATALLLELNRKIYQAYIRGLMFNFSLDGLLGFNIKGKTVGIIGTGHIGTAFARIMHGFGARLCAYDLEHNEACLSLGVCYTSLEQLCAESDIVSLHCPLNDSTRYIINKNTLALMKKTACLINTARGGLVDTGALIEALQAGQLAAAGLDVYEHERGIFFINHHGTAPNDEQLLQLQGLPNVVMTPHQAFFTQEAVMSIAQTTIDNLSAFEAGQVMNQL